MPSPTLRPLKEAGLISPSQFAGYPGIQGARAFLATADGLYEAWSQKTHRYRKRTPWSPLVPKLLVEARTQARRASRCLASGEKAESITAAYYAWKLAMISLCWIRSSPYEAFMAHGSLPGIRATGASEIDRWLGLRDSLAIPAIPETTPSD